MEDIVIAIRTAKRIDTIEEHTLKVIKDLPYKVYIFCPESEKKEYLKKYKGKYTITRGSDEGLNHANNAVHNYFANGKKILFMDDDITGVNKWNGEKFVVADLEHYIEEGFRLLKENNFKLFGFYPVKNGFFMKGQPEYSKGLQFCMGGIMGLINDKDLRTTTYKEDYERCIINYIKYGGIIRFNYVKVDNILYTNKGGQESIRTIKLMEDTIDELIGKYPDYCKRKVSKGKYPEMTLINKVYKTEYHLWKQLDLITWSKNTDRPNVSGLDEEKTKGSIKNKIGFPCYSYTFGYIRPRGSVLGTRELTRISKKYPLIYELVKKYAEEVMPDFKFTTITINRDIVCLPHTDKYNQSDSMIVAFGDYTEGGNLYIRINGKDKKFCIKNSPLIFNGRNLHWNDEANGRRYSLVFFNL